MRDALAIRSNRSRGMPGALPAALTTFIGRERELAEVAPLLQEVRLLTLTGAGGVGKTRLAAELAARARDHYADGVWWVDLAPLADPRLVPQAVAGALGIQEQPPAALIDTIMAGVVGCHLLLVLDNCEHLMDACVPLVDSLLRACPRLQLLATSRRSLKVEGEMTWRVPSLTLPADDGSPMIDHLLTADAVRLFIARAHMVRRGFALTTAQAAPVAAICRRLDGIPLALELAAARLTILTPAEIVTRLDDRFRLLTGGSRMVLPRQQTLRATIEWSDALLNGPARQLFSRLAVFAGGFTLAAIEAVCGSEDLPIGAILDLLDHLVDQSLVLADLSAGGDIRYRLLETVRQYAGERLAASDVAGLIRRQHACFFLAMAEEAEAHLDGPRHREWLDRLEAEHDNLRAALQWSQTDGAIETGLRLAGALANFWWMRGHLSEGRRWLTTVLASTDPDTAGLTAARASALDGLGLLAGAQGEYALARAAAVEAVAMWRAGRDRAHLANALYLLGMVSSWQGDYAGARAPLRESLALYRALDHPVGTATALFHLGYLAYFEEDYPAARVLFEESLALCRQRRDPRRMAYALCRLGNVALQQGDYRGAADAVSESLALGVAGRDMWIVPFSLEAFAALAAAHDQPERALWLSSAADALRETAGSVVQPAFRAQQQHWLEPARRLLSQEDQAAAWAAGRSLTLEQAVAEAEAVAAVVPPPHAAPAHAPVAPQSTGLTRRETEVLRLLARGATDAAIAAELSISVRTVNGHVLRILDKTNCENRASAAAFAVRMGLA